MPSEFKAGIDQISKLATLVDPSVIRLAACTCAASEECEGLINADAALFMKYDASYRLHEDQLIIAIPTEAGIAAKEEDLETGTHVRVSAVFNAVYSFNNGVTKEQLERFDLDLFAKTNGIIMTWPYWREFFQSTLARMALPPMALPFITLGQLMSQAIRRRNAGKEPDK